MNREKVYIYGKHALTEALTTTPHIIQKVFSSKGSLTKETVEKIRELKIPLGPLTAQKGVAKDAAHQGVIAVIEPHRLLRTFEEFLADVEMGTNTSVVLMDEIQDPHNVGAIIRSSAAFGASAVLIPERNQAQITGAVVKSSSGQVFTVPLVTIGNVNSTLRELKEKGFWVYGLAMKGSQRLSTELFSHPSVFVVGNEGGGIRRQTLELCDVRLRIPMHERTESLNAAVSAGIVLYEWSRQHPEALSYADTQ